jgi:alanine dehydrogenase
MEKLVVISISPAPVLLLDRTAIAARLNLDECIAAVEAAFAAHARGRSLAPQLLHVNADGGEFHIKTGGLRCDRTYLTCKIGGGFFNNRANCGLPNTLGLILLFDGANGVPLAVMEFGIVTRLRTGAATAVAAKYLARANSATATICGAGAQAEVQLRALTRVLPIERAFIWARSDPTAFCHRMSQELNIEVSAAIALEASAQKSDVIVTCTPAKRWLIGRQHVRPGTFIAAVGADSPDKQEIEPELLAGASVVCDLTAQALRVGDLHHAVTAGLMKGEQVRGELGAVIVGTAPRRLREDEIIVFDSTGTALQDCAAAAMVYERALSTGGCRSFGFWG